MISVDAALQLVLDNAIDFGTEEVSLRASIGRILAQDVTADRDFPPYHRVMMDGIAINSSAFNAGKRAFTIEKIQAAGAPRQSLDDTAKCIEVMTGAVLPIGTDIVIPYEQCAMEDGQAKVSVAQAIVMQHVHLQATDSKKGDLLLKKGQSITAAMVGVMASVGLEKVPTNRLPKITICSTGDELVDVHKQPQMHQVRKSNVYMLAAALSIEGIDATTIHLPDEPAIMKTEIERLIKSNDAILFSGAVSKGKFDYLPLVLEELGMKKLFHQVAQRPGKPFLFGRFSNNTLVFGFPGNPISTFVCYHVFFRRWLQKCVGNSMKTTLVRLADQVTFNPSLSLHLLVKLRNDQGTLSATPVSTSSSGDLVLLKEADAILTLPPEKNSFEKDEVYEVILVL